MSDHPHLSLGGTDTAWTWTCRCGATPTEYTAETARGPWGRDCPASMREEIAALRAQVEALKAAPANERASIVAFLRARRDALKNDIARRQMTRAATDVENGADHRD